MKDDKPVKETVYVDVDDEITSIIDKVEAAKAKIVALVLPKRAQVLQSIVNMRLLKRSADEADKSLVLITSEAAVLPLAGAAGVHVAKNQQSKPYVPASPIPIKGQAPRLESEDEPDEKDATLDYHLSMGELAVNEETDEPEIIHLAEDSAAASATGAAAATADKAKKAAKAIKDKKLKVPNFDKFRLRLILAAVGLVALIVFLFMAIKVLPKASIAIQTTGTPVSTNFNLTTSDSAKSLDKDKGIIPAALKTSDQTTSQQVQASGTQNNGNKAGGTISVSTTCTKIPSTVPAGTLATSNGLTYVSTDNLVFKNEGTDSNGNFICGGDVDLQASQGGNNYNLPSGSKFSIAGYSGTNSNAFTGGTDNNVTVVTQSDVDKVKQSITSQSSDSFSKNFEDQLSKQGLYVIASTLKVSDPAVTASPDVGQPASTASVTVKITYSVLAVKTDDLKEAVSNQLNKQIDVSKQKILDSDVLKNLVISIQSQTSPTAAALNLTADASATPNLDINFIKQQAEGQKKGDIQNYVSGLVGVKSVNVSLSPFWVSKAPKNPGKINVTLTQVQSSGQNAGQ